MTVEHKCCEAAFFINIGVIVLLVLFAGLMSGLTLGLMSMSLVDLEVLARSGTPKDRKHAAKILPVVRNQHLLLCTLLICNAAAMEALPIFLDSLVSAWGAILISVTLILLFGEIIPQSVCSQYGLAIGAAVAPVVQVLVWICFPIAFPISKLLDFLLGHERSALFRRAELKTLVDLHGNEAGKGGELTHDETTIIAGALELSEKKVKDAMTPIHEIFAVDINSKLDKKLMNLILDKGHSRVPVYYEQPNNIIGVILVKNLLTIDPEEETPVKNVTIRRIPRVQETLPLYDILNEFQKGHSHMAVDLAMKKHLEICSFAHMIAACFTCFRVQETLPLYDILNEFQKGHSHMAVVIRQRNDMMQPRSHSADDPVKEVKVDMEGQEKTLRRKRSLKKWKSFPAGHGSFKSDSRSRKWTKDDDSDILHLNGNPLPKLPEEEEAVGIITMEDVIEELLQEEIYDETDHHFEDS